MFNILTAQQRNPAGERTLNPIIKDLEFRIHRYRTKSQVPTKYCERIEYTNWSCFHSLFIEILGYYKTSPICKTTECRGHTNESSLCQNHKPQEWMACREGEAVVMKLWRLFCTCWSSLIDVFYPFSHSKWRMLFQILKFN